LVYLSDGPWLIRHTFRKSQRTRRIRFCSQTNGPKVAASTLSNAAIGIPIIFITGHGDIPMTVRAIRAGAVEFLTKPFRDQDLIDAVQTALARDRERRNLKMNVLDMRARFATLSPREKEVFSLVTAGLMNKKIAAELGLSEVTIKLHRGNVTKKMGARSLADLVRMADAVDIRQSPQQS
jgi:FixJ family two-component response regulator